VSYSPMCVGRERAFLCFNINLPSVFLMNTRNDGWLLKESFFKALPIWAAQIRNRQHCGAAWVKGGPSNMYSEFQVVAKKRAVFQIRLHGGMENVAAEFLREIIPKERSSYGV